MLLQVKSGCFAERIQLEICTRSLSVFESVFLKELKWNWAPSAEDNVKMCALQGTFPITVSFKQQKAQMWLLWECAEDVIMLFFPSAEKTMSAAHQAHWSVFAVIPSCPCLCWKLSTCSWCRAWASPGHREPSGSWVLPGAVLCWLLAPGRLSLGENNLAFLPMFWGAQGLGVWLPRLPTAFLTRCVLSDTDVPPLHHILPQKQHNVLAAFFILQMRDAP